MSDFNFLVFCLTIIVITAIVFDKDNIAEKALLTIQQTTKDFSTMLGDITKADSDSTSDESEFDEDRQDT